MTGTVSIGYFADGPWSHDALALLVSDPTIRIAFICARHERPDPVLKERAKAGGVPFFTHPNVNSREFLDKIASYPCDLFVSMSFNQIFRKELIAHPRLTTINCHAGKLPFYRGRNILNWALINDEKEFGITVHYVDEGIDTGDIVLQRVFPITDDDTYGSLLSRAYAGCAELLYEGVKALQSGSAARVPQAQIHPRGTYCTARVAGDERLDWNQSSREVFNFVRAISRPGPEARTRLRDSEVRINKVELLPDVPHYKGIPGAVIGVHAAYFLVKTRDSYVKVTEWSSAERVRIGDRLK